MAAPEENSAGSKGSAPGAEPPPLYPPSLLVEDLLKNHADYKGELIQKYEDAYEGGHEFDERKKFYLRERQLEKMPGGTEYRKARLAAAYYAPHVAGIFDTFIGQSLYSPPRFETKKDDARKEYWLGVCKNANGKGKSLKAVVRDLILNELLHKRFYLQAYEEAPVDAPSLAAQKESGGVSYRCCSLEPEHVTDWEKDEDGEFVWVRTYHVQLIRSQPFGPQDMERHCWTFFTSASQVEYVAEKKIGETWPKDAKASKGQEEAHGLGIVPIIEGQLPDGFWIMDRLYPIVMAFFNRESAREFCLDTGALNLPVIKTENNINSVVFSELGCLNVGPNGDFFWRSPDGAVYSALKDDCEYLLGNLYSVISAMCQRAANATENPRQSGVAKSQDKAPMEALLGLFCAPISEALTKFANAVAAVRSEEDLGVTLAGLDNFDTQGLQISINSAKGFLEVAGELPSAKRATIKRLSSEYFAEQPDVVAEINKEADAESFEAPAEIPANNDTQMTNGKTGEPQNAGTAQVRMQNTTN